MSSLKNKGAIIIFFIFALFCSKNGYDKRLVQYLKEEKKLRQRISRQQGLEDSIQALQRRYHINRERELAQLEERPKLWLKLLEELKGDR